MKTALAFILIALLPLGAFAQAITADSITSNPGNDLILDTGSATGSVISIPDLNVNGVTVGVGANGATLIDNTALGVNALGNPANTARFSVAIGYEALSSIGATFSGNHVAIGYGAMRSFNGTGNSNIAVGREVMKNKTSGGNNTGVGGLNLDVSGADNTAVGNAALGSSTADTRNSALGRLALRLTNGGSSNTGLGYQAGQANVGGSSNLFLGANAGAYELGSNTLYINSIDRINTTRDKAESIIYGVQNSNPLLQTLTFNAEVTVSNKIATTKFIEGTEQAASPAAAAANGFRIYAKDSGAGKTVLFVKFASGAEVQLAIEP